MSMLRSRRLDVTPKELSDRKRLSFNDSITPSTPKEVGVTYDNCNTAIVNDLYQSNEYDVEQQAVIEIPAQNTPHQTEEKNIVAENKFSTKGSDQSSLGVTSNQSFNRISASSKQTRDTIKQGEEEMAEVDTNMLAMQHSDIRREAAEHTNEIVKEGIKEAFNIRGDVKDSRYDIADRVGNQGDRIVDRVEESKDALMARTWDLGRESADNRAQIVALGFQVRDGFATASKDSEINALKTQIELSKQTTYLSDKIDNQAEKTRELINDLKYHDLNRHLVERNSELVEERNWGRHWYHGAHQAQFGQQFAQLQNQMQNFNSQLSETRQGMVNFGTMAGVGQTSSANNVR
jgi:hypothetical protein